MTRLNAKVKIHVVDELFAGEGCATTVWVSETVQQELKRLPSDLRVRFLKKLRHYAKSGFSHFTGGKGCPIRYEWDGVFRVAYAPSLLRMVGFFDGRGNAVFVAIDMFKERGRKLSAAERERIDAVATVAARDNWKKRDA